MGIMYEIKERKTLLLLAVLAGVIAFSFLLMLTNERAPVEKPQVISKRVRIEVPEELPSEPVTASNELAVEPELPETTQSPVVSEEPVKEPETTTTAAVMHEEMSPSAVETVKEPAKEPERLARLVPEPTKKKIAKPKPIRAAWAVNVASFTHKDGAEDLKRSLIEAGYNAYITEFTKGDVKFHRVRVGFYSSRSEAEKVGRKLERTFNMPGPWVVKPSKREVRMYSKR